jgi:hypothetical protein
MAVPKPALTYRQQNPVRLSHDTSLINKHDTIPPHNKPRCCESLWSSHFKPCSVYTDASALHSGCMPGCMCLLESAVFPNQGNMRGLPSCMPTHGLHAHTWAACPHMGCMPTHGLHAHTWAACPHMGDKDAHSKATSKTPHHQTSVQRQCLLATAPHKNGDQQTTLHP